MQAWKGSYIVMLSNDQWKSIFSTKIHTCCSGNSDNGSIKTKLLWYHFFFSGNLGKETHSRNSKNPLVKVQNRSPTSISLPEDLRHIIRRKITTNHRWTWWMQGHFWSISLKGRMCFSAPRRHAVSLLSPRSSTCLWTERST